MNFWILIAACLEFIPDDWLDHWACVVPVVPPPRCSCMDQFWYLALMTCFSVSQVTVISSIVFPSLPPQPLNIFFAVCILLACGSTIVLVRVVTATHLFNYTASDGLHGALLSTPADILVPAGRPGAQVQESYLLHAGVHRAAVFMCQPLLPRRQVRMTSQTRRRKGRAWPWQEDSLKDR